MLVRWPFTSRPQAVHASFVSALPSFLPKLPRLPEYEARGRWREGLLLHYKAWALQEPTLADLEQGRLQTVVPVFAPKDDSNVDERVVLCPLSGTQARCLTCLWRRWGFALKPNVRVTPLVKDVLVGLLYEMLRVLVHPFLGGCSERVLVEECDGSWPAAFRKASAKVSVLEHLIQGVAYASEEKVTHASEEKVTHTKEEKVTHTKEEKVTHTKEEKKMTHTTKKQTGLFFVYSRTVRVCQLLRRYFEATGREVVCLFGVKTQDELNAAVQRLRSGGSGMTVVILGLLPTSCSLCLDFVERVVLFDSDLIPSTDFEYLKSKFHITMHRVALLFLLHPSTPRFFASSQRRRWRWRATTPRASSSTSSPPSSTPPPLASPTPFCSTPPFSSHAAVRSLCPHPPSTATSPAASTRAVCLIPRSTTCSSPPPSPPFPWTASRTASRRR